MSKDVRECPYPIYCILNNAKALFEEVVSSNMHVSTFNDGLQKGLGLQVDWSPIINVADIDGQNKIHLYANCCQFLWMLNYTSLVVCDCSKIKDGILNNDDATKIEAQELFEEANRMQTTALRMFKGKVDNPKEMIVQRGELYDFPNPVNRKNKYTEIASALTICGVVYLLQHEFAHFIYEHYESTPAMEAEADKHAFERLLEWGKGNAYENIAVTGSDDGVGSNSFHKYYFSRNSASGY